MQPGTLGILTGPCGLKENQTGVWLRFRQYLGKDGAIELHQAMPQLMTSWGLLYQAFRSAFPASTIIRETPFSRLSWRKAE